MIPPNPHLFGTWVFFKAGGSPLSEIFALFVAIPILQKQSFRGSEDHLVIEGFWFVGRGECCRDTI